MTIKECVLLALCAIVNCVNGLPANTYRTEKGLICYLCPPGKFFVRDCSLDYETAICSPCPNGYYIAISSVAERCQPCSSVCPNTNYESPDDQPEIITVNCTSATDIQCECKPGFWRESGFNGMCRRAKLCEEGRGVKALATGNSDTVCEHCEPGQTFSNMSSANEKCRPCTQCDALMYVGRVCLPNRDTECILHSTIITTKTTTSLNKHGAQKTLHLGIGLGFGTLFFAGIVIVGVWCRVRRKRKHAYRSSSKDQLSSSKRTHSSESDLDSTSKDDGFNENLSKTSALRESDHCISGPSGDRGILKKEKDNTLSQCMMDIYRDKMLSVGAIVRSNEVVGTGFRVGKQCIVTALHVVMEIIDPRKCGEHNFSKLKKASIVFSDNPFDPSARHYNFSAESFYFYEDLDVAILEIPHPDGMLPKKLTLRKEPVDLVDTVSLIGYGHPGNSNKHFENSCQILYSNSHEINCAHTVFRKNIDKFRTGLLRGYDSSMVERGYQGHDSPHLILMHCFMEHGASGSPILACVNPSEGIVEVVGVLTRGFPEFYFCLDKRHKYYLPDNCRFEAGPRMTSIYERMTSQSNEIMADLFG
ncbi:uncharacterized protein LOC127845056 [Dreissena polymorpha]|uniref:TNFR-Cys domain-containing protein n=1 Tax=Dreissena polymorpha TaxID=45954 RepID=A0A9D4IMT0_DREPO|nr:uncharacterized protein LOC127845056 [Dreissena polymorpha]XP_052231655.1 uncharacterized protein LOC127845056 [Dreissena polymorpha]XP_052231656.1 uncharacterized protein LOC127845056 [Dreissena polymorpha]XP_052231657.1 uncharacterized protein LOC127845056 [Dreissena polymorpha]KAH3778492.1 hypothetical protein DPMN_179952 [Dreissena polymorpha]